MAFIIKQFEGQLNWNKDDITLSGYAENICIFYRLNLSQQCFFKYDVAYHQAKIQHPTKFAWRDTLHSISNLILVVKWPENYCWSLYGYLEHLPYNCSRCMPKYLTDDYTTLIQVMAWCRQTTNHCLNQCYTSSITPYNLTRAQWVDARLGRRDGSL